MNFYVINNQSFDDSSFAYGEDFGDINLGRADKCEVCSSVLTSRKWLPPHKIRVSKRNLGDTILGTFDNLIVSAKFKESFQEIDLKGIKSYQPVAIYFQNRLLGDRYFYAEIEMSDFFIDLNKSGFELEGEPGCPVCQKAGSIIKKWDGIIFEHPETINLDIFTTKLLPGTLCVSESFRNFVVGHDLSNISMIEASKFKTSWSID